MRQYFQKLDSVGSLQLYNLAGFAKTLLMGILLVKSELTPEEVSAYESLLFLSALVSMFWVMGGQNALLVHFGKLSEARRKLLIFHVFVLFVGGSFVAALVLYLGGDWLVRYFTSFGAIDWGPQLLCFTLLHPAGLLIHIYYLLLNRERKILSVGIPFYVLQLLAVLLPVYLGYGLGAGLWGLVAVAALRFIWVTGMALRHGTPHWRWAVVLPYLVVLLPLLLRVLVGSSSTYIDGLLVGALFEDEASFAIFRYGARELPLSVLLVSALVTVGIARIAENRTEGLELMRRRSTSLMHWLFPLSAVLMVASPSLFRWFYSETFVASAAVFNVYLLLAPVRILLPQTVMMAEERTYWLVWFAVAETVVNVGLSIWWAQEFGMVGIAFATVVAYGFNKVLMIVFCRRALSVRVRDYLDLRWYGLHTVVLTGVYVFCLLRG